MLPLKVICIIPSSHMKDKTVVCPECQNNVDIQEDVRVGDVIECPHCGSELRITQDEPLTVEVIQEEK